MALLKKGILLVMIISIFLSGSTPNAFSSKALAAENHKKATLSTAIESLLSTEPELKGSLAGISIRDRESGTILFEHMSDLRLTPASNMKLLTSAVALKVLGEDYQFITEIYGDGRVEDGHLKGNLYIKGNGDTSLLATDLEKMAKELKNKGIRYIDGNVIGDDSWYDDTPYSIDLAWSDETSYYGAPISALTLSPNKEYDAGTVLLEIKPGKNRGDSVEITSMPKTTEIQLVNKAKTGDKESGTSLKVRKKHNSKVVTITGRLPITTTLKKEWIPVNDPTKYTLDVFQQALKKEGIQWNGTVKKGKTPQIASLITTHSSMPLSELLIPLMKLSNNTIAETLVKEMGVVKKGKGSFEKGLEVMEEELIAFQLDPKNMLIRDGSGISPIDFISANDLSLFLYEVQAEPWFSTFSQALPVSGMEERMVGGTLRNRLNSENTKGNVLAKTGTLTAVSTLSGYMESSSGKKYIFSILLNHLVDEEKGKDIEDKIIETLAEY
ncbi:D-alanyl-D-alanine carboxypeptidase/D-alanyl-D-alanine endopeptidase [Niallia sp. FSL W8-0635]|uniref:D-alanyl-D-alanine carboxypeptidase/D-alanyl-D-alanine endopeptidase n=1 Tax=Niallia sp. FSL W8-0635 TaxID=2975337 RepID=UPI0009D57230|nr:D-alanyl-D-alanine carboxypeptidase (penicillin-binding protein 4) [Mycobacteroides abscessus subsp. abscessus]HEO8419090.1 D-alanyl-D-alanine carboxypeptidase/D-alanyl-D-alanine-endopeptidase [Yersinia enterocolitica]